MASFLCFFIFFHLASSAYSACENCVHKSKASYFSQDSALSSGACEYGPIALEIGDGNLAAGVPSLYRQGATCGACFQVRCKNQDLCNEEGTKVLLTDLNHNNQTDLVLSRKAFAAMAQKGKSEQVTKLGIVDIEYKRVPCVYENKNLSVRIEESSKKPDYLAITFLYEGGATDKLEVDVGEAEAPNWSFLTPNHGAVWETDRVPKGPLWFRLVVEASFARARYILAKNLLPADWKNGGIYDLGFQITDINPYDGCLTCGDGQWS